MKVEAVITTEEKEDGWQKFLFILLALPMLGIDCGGEEEVADPPPSAPVPRYLYVASGNVNTHCYGGGVTAAAGAGVVAKYNLSNQALESIVIDYAAFSPGDSPVGLAEYDDEHLLVLVENTGGRRIDLVKKNGENEASVFIINGTALSAQLRRIINLADGGFLVSKSTAIEKFSSTKARITQGANPYINAPAGSCATSATLMSDIVQLPSSEKIIFLHANTSPNNKIGMISSTGYSVTGDCLAVQAAPATTAMPTAAVAHSGGKLLVAYGSTTAASNFIYSYDVNETSNTINGAVLAYNNNSIINGPSAMVEDTDTGEVYVANATSTANTIEKFTFDPTAGTLSRDGSMSFLGPSVFTKCVTSMMISDQ